MLSKKEMEKELFELLKKNEAIEIVEKNKKMFRGIGLHPRHCSRQNIGHWWTKEFDDNYAFRGEQGYSTIVVGTAKHDLLFAKFQDIFICGPVNYRSHCDGELSNHPISNPTIKEEYEKFKNLDFLRELKRLMMLADDNLSCDEFVTHSGNLELNNVTFAGIGNLCPGDPVNADRGKDEYWILEPAQCLNLLKKRYWGEGSSIQNYFVTDSEDKTDAEQDTDVEFNEHESSSDESSSDESSSDESSSDESSSDESSSNESSSDESAGLGTLKRKRAHDDNGNTKKIKPANLRRRFMYLLRF